MNRFERINNVRGLAAIEETRASDLLRQSNEQLAELLRQVNSLEYYRDHYALQLTSEVRSRTVDELRGLHDFIAKLNTGIESATREIAVLRDQVEQRREHWASCYQHLVALERVCDRLREEERRAADKREQSQLNDLIGLRNSVNNR